MDNENDAMKILELYPRQDFDWMNCVLPGKVSHPMPWDMGQVGLVICDWDRKTVVSEIMKRARMPENRGDARPGFWGIEFNTDIWNLDLLNQVTVMESNYDAINDLKPIFGEEGLQPVKPSLEVAQRLYQVFNKVGCQFKYSIHSPFEKPTEIMDQCPVNLSTTSMVVIRRAQEFDMDSNLVELIHALRRKTQARILIEYCVQGMDYREKGHEASRMRHLTRECNWTILATGMEKTKTHLELYSHHGL